MTMSISLLIVSALLLVGWLITSVLAWLKPRFAAASAAITSFLVLLAWLLVGRGLPASLGLPYGELVVDKIAWQFSLFLILLVVAAAVISIVRSNPSDGADQTSVSQRATPPLLLLAMTAALSTLWASALTGLLKGLALQAVVWLLLVLAGSHRRGNLNRILGRLFALSIGWIFLWLAVAVAGDSTGIGLNVVDWPDLARIFFALAVLALLGIFPLHWWRPSDLTLPPDIAALIHIFPTATGAFLFARMAMGGDIDTRYTVLFTAAGLLGLLFGISRAWTNIGKPARVTMAVALAQPGLILLVGAWAGVDAIVLETQVFILAVGALFLANAWPRPRPGWHIIVAAAGISGLPLTAGFASQAVVYSGWLLGGNPILLLVTLLLSLFLIGAACLATWHRQGNGEQSILSRRATMYYGFALVLLAVGLLTLPSSAIGETSPVSWLIILLVAAGGFGLNLYVRKARELRAIFHFEVPYDRFFDWCASVLSPIGSALQAATDIVESEAGMLWLLVLVVIFLLAQSGL